MQGFIFAGFSTQDSFAGFPLQDLFTGLWNSGDLSFGSIILIMSIMIVFWTKCRDENTKEGNLFGSNLYVFVYEFLSICLLNSSC